MGVHVDEARQDIASGKIVDGSARRWTIAGRGKNGADAAAFDLNGAIGWATPRTTSMTVT